MTADGDTFRFEREKDRALVTFLGGGDVPEAVCTRILARIEREAPTSVQVLCDFASPGDSWSAAMRAVARPLASITAFVFDTYFQTQTRQGENHIGDLADTLAACPNLLRVFATGDLAMSPCKRAALRELHLLGNPLDPALLRALAESSFPALERLVVSLSSDADPPSGGDELVMRAFVALAREAESLRALYMGPVPDLTTTLVTLANGGLPKSLTTLTVEGNIDDEDALLDVLKKHAATFRSLDALELPLGDYVSSDASETAAELVPSIRDVEDSLTLPAAYEDW